MSPGSLPVRLAASPTTTPVKSLRIVVVSFALAAMVQPSKGGDVIEVLADEGVVTRVVASEDGRFAGVVAGEARGCSVAAMVQPAVAARCSRWAMSIYCCRVETNGYI